MIDILNLHFISFIHPNNLITGELCGDYRKFGVTVNTVDSSTKDEDCDEVGILHGVFFSYQDIKCIKEAIDQGYIKTLTFLSDNDFRDIESECPPREGDPVVLKRSDLYELIKMDFNNDDFVRVTISIFGDGPKQNLKLEMNVKSKVIEKECSKLINDFERYAVDEPEYQPRKIVFESAFF